MTLTGNWRGEGKRGEGSWRSEGGGDGEGTGTGAFLWFSSRNFSVGVF